MIRRETASPTTATPAPPRPGTAPLPPAEAAPATPQLVPDSYTSARKRDSAEPLEGDGPTSYKGSVTLRALGHVIRRHEEG